MIDTDGFRSNVGIILSNRNGRLLWARRLGQDAWQFPQGGVNKSESLEDALFRELTEEVGLKKQHVEILARTDGWVKYRLPENLIRYDSTPVCIGQKQIWFLLLLTATDNDVNLMLSNKPEFDQWCWVEYWHPLSEVVMFKYDVYKKVLKELEPHLSKVN